MQEADVESIMIWGLANILVTMLFGTFILIELGKRR